MLLPQLRATPRRSRSTLAAVTGALNVGINVIAWDEVRRAARLRPSQIIKAQVRSRWTKLLSSLTVQVTMTLAAVAKDPMLAAMADAVGALLVSGVMIVAARDLLADSLPDLLDRSMDLGGAPGARAGDGRGASTLPLPASAHAAPRAPSCSK